MNNYLSDKLRVISFISIIMVVFIHSLNLSVNFNTGNIELNNRYNIFIQEFISQGIATIAVPLFFCISGYLFFLKFNGTFSDFSVKFKKRVKSLFVLYLIWSFWGLFFYFILQLFPQSQNFFTKTLVADYSFSEFLNTLFINPIPYQLWFLRDLMMLVLASPIIYWALRYFRILIIVVLFILWLGIFDFDFFVFKNESVLFFSLGAYLSYHWNILLKKEINQKYWMVMILWFVVVYIKTAMMYLNSDQSMIPHLLGKLSILIGIIAVWKAYDLWMKNKTHVPKTVYNLSLYSFIIFVFHEPILTFVKKGMFFVTGTSEAMFLINYFVSPLIAIVISIIVGAFLKKTLPNLYNLVTAGR